jgi:predicted  nucleic acid-binding Zn-ribbon protein
MKRLIKKIVLGISSKIVILCFAGLTYAGIDDGVVAYYPFNGNANDESGNGNHGVVSGATLSVDRFGNLNSAFRFNGLDNYIKISSSAFDPASHGSGSTVVAWVKANDLYFGGENKIRPIISKRNYGGLSYSPQFLLTLDGRNRLDLASFYLGNSAESTDYSLVSAGNRGIQTGQWYMIAGVFNSITGSKSIYVNGQLISSANHVAFPPVSPYEIFIGRTEYLDFFDGLIDDVRFYNRGLSSAEMLELFSATSKNDEDGDGVSDPIDKCPGTPIGSKVDVNGCPIDCYSQEEVNRLIAAAIAEKDAIIDQKDAVILQYNSDIAVLNKTISHLNALVAEKAQEIDVLKQTVVDLSANASKKDQQIKDLTAKVAELQQEIINLGEAIVGKDQQIKNLSTAIDKLEKKVASLKLLIDSKNQRITKLSATVAENETQILGLISEIARKDQQLTREKLWSNTLNTFIDSLPPGLRKNRPTR